MSDIKVSVIVPVYNQEVYLREALDSLKAQTLKDIEFIIINDGSTDSSIDIINEYAEGDDRFIVVDKENGGVAVAINTGNKMARGEYLAEMDSDDYVAPDMYEKLYDVAKEYDVDIVKSNVINFTGLEGTDSFNHTIQKIAQPDYYDRIINPAEEDIILSFPMYAWCSLYRRELIIDNDIMWNDGVSSYNDNGFFWQTMGLAKSVMYIDEDYIYHRRDNEASTVKDPDKMFKNFFIEHEFIKNKLKERGLFESVKSYFFERKINNYFFALSVIPYEKKQEFFHKIAEDFKVDIAEEGLAEVDFTNYRNKVKINDIVNNPDQFFYQTYLPAYYRVSVIIPVHNAENYFKITMDNLVNQSLKEIEIILVENGSTDNTQEIIDEYVRKDPRVTSVSIGKSNPGHARNVGLDMAHGQYVIFLDADDEYDEDLLKKTYWRARETDAEVVWFNTQEKNAKTGLTKPHTHAFRKSQIPSKTVFSFSEIKGNPYDAFIGWPWDKLYSMSYIQASGLKYQPLNVSNDGYFNFLAMTKANRITCIDDVLVTRVIEHGNNISSSRHDKNPDNQLTMILSVYDELKKISQKHADEWKERSIQLIQWLFTTGFKTTDGVSKYFDLLVDGGIEKLALDKLDADDLSEDYRKSILRKLLLIPTYQVGDYEKFIAEVGKEEFELKQSKNIDSYTPDVKVQNREGRIVFGQKPSEAKGSSIPVFNIVISNTDTSNASAIIDFMYMGNFKKVIHDTLNLSISLQEKENELVPIVHQAEWEKGENIMMNNIFYTFDSNVFTIHIKYPEQFTGFEYKFRDISSREGQIHFSVVNVARGYLSSYLLPSPVDLKPITEVTFDFLPVSTSGNRVIFRTENTVQSGQDLFVVDLKPFQFNNIVLAVDIAKVPNGRAAVYDRLYLGMSVEINDQGEASLNVFQAEWEHAKQGLQDRIYFHTGESRLYLGARYNEQWAGYNFKLVSITGREYKKDYEIRKIAPELVNYPLGEIPKHAVYINDKAE